MKFNAYNVFLISVVREQNKWFAYLHGEGKKRLMEDMLIPSELNEDEIQNYLEVILHEYAQPKHPNIIRLD